MPGRPMNSGPPMTAGLNGLADSFARVQLNPNQNQNQNMDPRLAPSNPALRNVSANTTAPLQPNPNSQPVYEAFRFRKSDPGPGQKPTWRNPVRTALPFTQPDLVKAVGKSKRRGRASDKYNELDIIKQGEVDLLIDTKNRLEKDPRTEWKLASIETEKKLVGRGRDYETASMDVILERKLKPAAGPLPPQTVHNNARPTGQSSPPRANVVHTGERYVRGLDGSIRVLQQGSPAGPMPGMQGMPGVPQQQHGFPNGMPQPRGAGGIPHGVQVIDDDGPPPPPMASGAMPNPRVAQGPSHMPQGLNWMPGMPGMPSMGQGQFGGMPQKIPKNAGGAIPVGKAPKASGSPPGIPQFKMPKAPKAPPAVHKMPKSPKIKVHQTQKHRRVEKWLSSDETDDEFNSDFDDETRSSHTTVASDDEQYEKHIPRRGGLPERRGSNKYHAEPFTREHRKHRPTSLDPPSRSHEREPEPELRSPLREHSRDTKRYSARYAGEAYDVIPGEGPRSRPHPERRSSLQYHTSPERPSLQRRPTYIDTSRRSRAFDPSPSPAMFDIDEMVERELETRERQKKQQEILVAALVDERVQDHLEREKLERFERMEAQQRAERMEKMDRMIGMGSGAAAERLERMERMDRAGLSGMDRMDRAGLSGMDRMDRGGLGGLDRVDSLDRGFPGAGVGRRGYSDFGGYGGGGGSGYGRRYRDGLL